MSEHSGHHHSEHHHSGSHNRHHSSHDDYRKQKKRKQILGTVVICLLVAAIGGLIVYRQQTSQKSMYASATNSHDVGSGYRKIEYNGKTYEFNNRVSLIVYAGLDSEGTMEAADQYGNSDSPEIISLAILDEYHKKVSVLTIAPGTMTSVRRYSESGAEEDLETTRIADAFVYGNGGKASCQNLCESVSQLLGDIPVREYIVANQDSLKYLNNLTGKISVKVPNNDLADTYPELSEGETATLNDNNVVDYLRFSSTGDGIEDTGLSQRRESYVDSYITRLQNLSKDQQTSIQDAFGSTNKSVQTNLSADTILRLIGKLGSMEFTEENYLRLSGTAKQENGQSGFYPDEEALQEQIISLFYLEA